MALKFNNRVKETCAAPGTGTVTLLGPVTGFVGFSTIGTTNTTYYTIADQTGNNWEVGLGTWTTGGSYGTLARTTVFSNSLGTTAYINFASGTQDVFITGPSEKYIIGSTTVSNTLLGDFGTITAGKVNNVFVGIGQGAYANGSVAIGKNNVVYFDNGVAIGNGAMIGSSVFQPSVVISGTGSLSPTNGGFYVDTLRSSPSPAANAVVKYNTTTKEISYDTAASSGTVTNVSVVAANGFNGTVATSTTTPAITLRTSVNGLLQGNGTALSAVTVGSGLSFTSGTLSAPPATPTVSGTVLGNTTSGGLVALGYDAIVTGSNSVAVGTGTNVTGASAVAMGQGVILDYAGSVLIGANAGDTGANAVVIGASSVSGNGSITIGSGIFNNQANSIALSTNGSFTTPNSGVFIDSMRDESAGSPNKTLKYNTTTKEIFYGVGGGGNGTVTDVSIVAANGFNGTVATSTTTPAITLTTSVTGVLKGNGTAISAAAAGTDYAPATTGTSAQLLANNGTGGFDNVTVGSGLSFTAGTLAATSTGGVTSVDVLGGTTGLTTSGGPITSSGNITLGGTLVVQNGGTGLTTLTTNYIPYGNGTGALASSANLTFDGSNLKITGTGYSPDINLTDATNIAWNTALGQVATFTFVSNSRTMNAPTNLVNGGFYALEVIQSTGNMTLTWNSAFKWPGGVAPTLSTTAGARDFFIFRSDGTNLYLQGQSLAVA
jgi:hypothetical protein